MPHRYGLELRFTPTKRLNLSFDIYCDKDRLSTILYHVMMEDEISQLPGIAGSDRPENQAGFHFQDSPLS